jgi:hypothetical protein
VTRVDDRRDVPQTPRERPFLRAFYHFDSFYIRTARGLSLARPLRALGVNAVDEVPDSTWFTNRIGVREVAPEELRRGPAPVGNPDQYLPWKIVSSKTGGTAVGFVVEDRRGVRFLLKFDTRGIPEVETGADAIVARILWAIGFNVPEDDVVYFRIEDLQLSPTATTRNSVGQKVRLTQKIFDAQLAQVEVGSDGRIRGLASLFIAGKPLGGALRQGVRDDDPNDRIPHERRRDLRGQASIFAWLDHTDIKEDNTLDAWQADPRDPAIHYVVHYLLDFGNALGTQARVLRRPSLGREYVVDPLTVLRELATFGLWPRGWEGRAAPEIRGVGLFESKVYDPGAWKPNTFGHLPIIIADRFDQFWGARLLIRLTPAQLAVAIEAARYSDPRAADYMREILIARQRITARYWFERVLPIDDVRAEAASGAGQRARVCFADLLLRHDLARGAVTYRATAYDRGGRRLGDGAAITAAAAADGSVCLSGLPLSSAADRYTILHVDSSRAIPGARLHLAADPATGAVRLIGLERL